MPDYRAFGRRLKELVAGESQYDVAAKLGYTQSRVSQMMRGERPSREFVERLVDAYGLDREEWLGLAGFAKEPEEPGAEKALERLQIAADRVTHTLDVITARLETVAEGPRPPYGTSPADERETWRMLRTDEDEEESGSKILLEGLAALNKELGRPIAISLDDEKLRDLTPDKARATLAFWQEQARKGLI